MNEYIQLNRMESRHLKNGEWILLARSNYPIVVSDEVKKILENHGLYIHLFDQGFIKELYDNGFIKNGEEIEKPIVENKKLVWIIARICLIIMGVFSGCYILFNCLIKNIPNMFTLLPTGVGWYKALIFDMLLAIGTTFLHEMMHMIFSHNFKINNFRIDLKKSTAEIALSDIWTWSMFGRVVAVISGMVLDLVILAVLIYFSNKFNNWMLVSACSVLSVRFLWQFRFQKRCDGQLLIAMIKDDPFLAQKFKSYSNMDYKLRLLFILGHLVTLVIIMGWIFPLLIQLPEIFL